LLLALSDSAVADQNQASSKQLSILFTTDLYGRFGQIDCKKAIPQIDFANIVGAIGQEKQKRKDLGLPEPLVLNGGDNIGPYAFSRFILKQRPAGAELMASWFKKAEFDLIALGNQDFYATPKRLRAYLEAGQKAGLVFSAGNLECPEENADLCPLQGASQKNYQIFERAGLKIAVFSLIHGDLEQDVDKKHMLGLKTSDPIAKAREIVAAARKDGADLVFALSHLDHSETSPRQALKLARNVIGLDLIIANAFTSAEGERAIGYIKFADGVTPIVGCDLFGQHLCQADIELSAKPEGWKLELVEMAELDPAQYQSEPSVSQELDNRMQAYCDEWNQPICTARLSQPMQAADFENYLMEIMRHTTKRELVFINKGLVNPRAGFPIEGMLTKHTFFSALPHRNRIYTFKLDVAALEKLCSTYKNEQALSQGGSVLLMGGLECGDKIMVNGRDLESGETYSAVTIEYLAKGMLGYFKEHAGQMKLYNPARKEEAPVLGEIARKFFSAPKFNGPRPQAIDLISNFPDLSQKMRWGFEGGLNLNISDTSISNTPNYTESQLNREEFVGIKGELRGKIKGSSNFHGLLADFRMKYAKSSTADQPFIESEDLITLNLVYKLKGLKGKDSGWYVPYLYAESKTETELTKPDENEHHHLEETVTLGARFSLLPPLEVKAGFGLRQEVLDPDADLVYGIDLGYDLTRVDVLSIMGSPVQFESSLGAFFGDVGRSNTLKGQWINRIYFALVGPLFFNVTHELFVYRSSKLDYSFASDLTFGLSYNARTAFQTF
jgi:2',3'-cyclic-nucleotide 2'-phosphodiesterase (5'-nucleotidase family)